MRIERSVTSVSWIPREQVVGWMATAFELGMAHYDAPPPDQLADLEHMRQAGLYRFANHLQAWIEVQDGRIVDYGHAGQGYIGNTLLRVGPAVTTFSGVRFPELRSAEPLDGHAVRFVQTAGGRTGAPLPRHLPGALFVSLVPPAVWTTLALTIHADGSHDDDLVGASPFPRHWIYTYDGNLRRKVAVADYETWVATVFGNRTPWGGHELAATVIDVESPLEHQLSVRIMAAPHHPTIRRLRPGETLVRQGEPGRDIFLILNGLLAVERDGQTLVRVGPGSILGERATLGDGRRTASLIALTPVTVAATHPSLFEATTLQELVAQEDRRTR